MSDFKKIETAVGHVRKGTEVGKTITSISSLGTISLNSKDTINTARAMYDNLSDSDKHEVINLNILTKAENRYSALLEEQEKRIEEERRAKEEAAREKAEKEEKQNYTVYVATSGEKYHSGPDCPSLSRSKNLRTMTQKQAIDRGYGSCSKCVYGSFLP